MFTARSFFEGHSEALQKTLQELSGVYYLESEDDELTLRAQLPLDGALAKLTEKLRERIRRSQAQKEVLHSVQDKAGGQPAVVFSGEDVGVLLGEVSGEGEAFLRAALGDPKIYYEMEAHLTTSQAPQFLIFSGHCANAPSRLELTQAGRRLPLSPKDADQISQDFELKREPSAAYVFKLPPTLRSGPAQLLWHVSTQGEPQDVRTGSCRLDFPPFVL